MRNDSLFENRIDAGIQLAEKLPELDPRSTIVVALPRGGVPIGAVIAQHIGCPLEVLLIRKIGVPGQQEVALGAVAVDGKTQISINEDIMVRLGLNADDVKRLAEEKLPELEERRQLYFGDRESLPFVGRTLVLVDDGVATGATMEAALNLVSSREPAAIILALPVAPENTIAKLASLADQAICLHQPEHFLSVGSYYIDFGQVENEEVIAHLEACRQTG